MADPLPLFSQSLNFVEFFFRPPLREFKKCEEKNPSMTK